jgi:uncharacterized SAM-binding protein YcdF (DUF218 family)
MRLFDRANRETVLKRLCQSLLWLFCGLGLLVAVVTFTPLVSWWGGALAGPWADPKGDVLIVLSGSSANDGIIGESSYLRAQYAVLAYRRDGFRTIVLSGGGQPIPAAMAMRDFMVGQGVPPGVIITETASTSTRQNGLYTRKLLEDLPGKKVLLTSDYHMFRAYRVFRKLGLEVAPRPIPDARKRAATFRGRWPAFLDLLEETVKISYYYARGWI